MDKNEFDWLEAETVVKSSLSWLDWWQINKYNQRQKKQVGIFKRKKKVKKKERRFRPRKKANNDNGQEKKKESTLSAKKVRFKIKS